MEVEGNYPNSEQKLTEQQKFHLKSRRKPAAVWQMSSGSSKILEFDT